MGGGAARNRGATEQQKGVTVGLRDAVSGAVCWDTPVTKAACCFQLMVLTSTRVAAASPFLNANPLESLEDDLHTDTKAQKPANTQRKTGSKTLCNWFLNNAPHSCISKSFYVFKHRLVLPPHGCVESECKYQNLDS
ncbi:hypothetical protein FQA47_014556 [Oryzias melastigma]|uniref:Uncharacterized protein n=1 Tax=Oryzias melastigma TaxID=30732 RepID=A0A834FKP8_ORYME|nr:hypothetical protein FQA47_014556 [Oryzias melastigma]